jgi:single-strand DNA-binding protein
MSLNQIMLIGNAGTDPSMRYTPSGQAVADFRLAVNYRRAAQEGEQPQDETEWFTVVCWNRLAEQVNQYLAKGRRAFVQGRFRSRSYVGNDGQTRTVNEVIAARVLFLDRAGEGAQEGAAQGDGGYARAGAAGGRPRASDSGPEEVEELPW